MTDFRQDKLKGCPCLDSMTAYSQPGTRSEWNEAQQWLKALVDVNETKPEQPQCDATNRVTLDTTAFTA
jgi:hypothetical protein